MVASDGTRYGRTPAEWAEMVDVARQFLTDQARMGRMTTYTELNAVLGNRTTCRTFDFELESERAALGELLGEVTELERPSCGGHMISSIVIYLNENDAGKGFYNLAELDGDLPKRSTPEQRLAFWSREVESVHNNYRRERRRS